MIRPTTLNSQPSFAVLLAGGTAGSVLLGALMLLAREYALIDFPGLLGGLFFQREPAAFQLGFWLVFASGVLLFPPLLGLLWNALPGNDTSMPGALIKGLLAGIAVWLLTGLVLPLLARANSQTSSLASDVGFFAFSHGAVAAIGLAMAILGYFTAVTLVASMTGGLKPLELPGWEGYDSGNNQKESIY